MKWALLFIVVGSAIVAATLYRSRLPGARWPAALASSIIAYALAWMGWWALLYFGIVPLHAPADRNAIEPHWMRLIMFGPPLLPAAVLFFCVLREPHDKHPSA